MSTRDRVLGILLLLVVVTTAVFWQVRNHDFVSLDDGILVYNNKYYLSDNNSSLIEVWRKPHEQLFMPLTYTAWATLAEIARVTPTDDPSFKPASEVAPYFDPGIFHSFNLLLHVLSVLLIFAILRLLFRNDWAAAAGALLFGLHPVQVESVAWISELKGVMGGFFGLLAVWLYLCYVRALIGRKTSQVSESVENESSPSNPEPEAAPGAETTDSGASRAALLYILATFSFVAALLSKPSAVTYPLIAALLDYFFLRRSAKAAFGSIALWFVLAIPIVWKAREAQPVTEQLAPLWARPLVALDALAFYIGKIVWPLRLAPEYTRTPRLILEQGWAYWTWIMPVAVGILLWWFRRYKTPLAAASIFLVVLLPVLGFIPFVFQYYSTVADRYLYVAMLAPALVVAWLLARRPRPISFAICALLLLVYAALSFRQTSVWRDDQALYHHTLQVNPRAWFARNNLANIYEEDGEFKKAEKLYREALQLRPDLMDSYVNLGAVLLEQKRVSEALAVLVKAAELSSPVPETYINLGEAYITLEKYDFALLSYRRAAFLEPDNPTFQFKLAELYLRLKQPSEAAKHLEKARQLAVNPQSFHATAASMYSRLNLLSQARDHYVAAIKLRPDNPQLHNDLGATLLRAGNPKLARTAFEIALEIDPNYPEAYHNLGLALAAEGNHTTAEKVLRRAIELNPEYSQAHISLAEALLKQNKIKQARAALQRALKIDPQNERARNLMKTLQ